MPSALALPHHEPDRHRDGDQDVGDGEEEVGPGPLVDPVERRQELEHREDPEAEDRDPHQARVGVIEQEPRDRLREGEGAEQADRRGPEERREGGLDDLPGLFPRLVVEAQQSLDDPGFRALIGNLLKKHINKSIEEIGNLDLAHTL